MSQNINGFDELINRLDSISNKASELNGKTQNFDVETLFDSSFMKEHTNFSSFSEMFENSPVKVETQEDFDNLSTNEEFNEYIKNNSKFENWTQMIQFAAGTQYAKQIFE